MTVTEKSVGHDSRPLSPPIPKANPIPLWGATGVYPSPFLAVDTNRWHNDHSCPPHTPKEDDCPRWGDFD